MGEPIDLRQVQTVLDNHEKTEASLIPVLQELQEFYGYLPKEALLQVSRDMNIPLSRIYGVVTFYAQFHLTPRGRHTVRVCRGTACHVRGGKSVLKAVQQALGVGENETTPDFTFTFETVACLGACALSPVLLVDKNYYGKLTPAKVDKILKHYS
jgi:NADH:ubiquinone oxidoreductase subunit E